MSCKREQKMHVSIFAVIILYVTEQSRKMKMMYCVSDDFFLNFEYRDIDLQNNI